ncbi:MAG: Protein GrpE [Candidatus Wolfebacteria bacterium GW2011_GWA1_44_24]|uniref:Protein GrpE n=2 Tax=Candidatus Wolfeibacteriota TaxID=1752735 RepID=A0A0G0WWE8_9BACT|nr:MAG: Protein GrpE [Candidatus Wolfebacteria bacterium GW2011_GWB1_41_12]KKT56596.1 MAG: Protein GrpE [Candidatus Wolfebacteria bacterium GW2011_GWA1_44_24]
MSLIIVSIMTDDLAKCQKERDENLEGWKRAKADLLNYKKDESKRFEIVAKFSQEGLIRELIKTLDSFDLALAALEKEGKAEKGIYLIRAQIEDTLRQNGLERVAVSVGQPFDPNLQEAIVSVESDKPSDTVVEEVERGYLLHGKLIRPARVKVAK